MVVRLFIEAISERYEPLNPMKTIYKSTRGCIQTLAAVEVQKVDWTRQLCGGQEEEGGVVRAQICCLRKTNSAVSIGFPQHSSTHSSIYSSPSLWNALCYYSFSRIHISTTMAGLISSSLNPATDAALTNVVSFLVESGFSSRNAANITNRSNHPPSPIMIRSYAICARV